MARRNRWELHDTRKSTYYSLTTLHSATLLGELPPTASDRVLRVQQPERNARPQRAKKRATVPLNSFNIHVLIYRPIRAPAAFKFSLSLDCWKSTNESWAVCFMKVSSLVISRYLATRALRLCHLSFSYVSAQYFCLFSLRPRRFVPDRFVTTPTKPFAFTNSVSRNISCLKIFSFSQTC